ncbi:hypothetical protein [Thalassobius sp. MITS945101]|uniref:hypothetical protein n=1 Tax=Thalassobius sp. MITS945101 TaxID=3096994 RepID=UPI00399ABB8A
MAVSSAQRTLDDLSINVRLELPATVSLFEHADYPIGPIHLRRVAAVLDPMQMVALVSANLALVESYVADRFELKPVNGSAKDKSKI